MNGVWTRPPNRSAGCAPRRPCSRNARSRCCSASPTSPAARWALSTGWALKARLVRQQVKWLTGCQYQRIDDAGLHVSVNGQPQVLAVDSIVLCAGQERERSLFDRLQAAGIAADVIGGADKAEELDALRAIDQGTRLAWSL
jgi:2,4-dienoyl-CoA reductase (NADPH2)